MPDSSSADAHSEPGPGARAGRLTILGWACYLACSWTWCIGMFLPVLLVRDYGIWGFVVFAVPNVIGAAAMGWVLRKPGASDRVVSRHRAACTAFSFITIAFQIFFLVWLRSTLDWNDGTTRLFVIPTAAAAFAGLACLVRPVLWRVLAGAVLSVSVIALMQNVSTGALFREAPTAHAPPATLLALAASCVFGFVLCPYLDLSFHRTRRSAGGVGGTIAFLVAFGLLFPLMLIYTLGYATLGGSHLRAWLEQPLRSLAATLLMVHLLIQLVFTIWVHADAIRSQSKRPSILVLTVFACLFVTAGLGPFEPIGTDPLAEYAYRVFMSFYGLVFPAYVWLCMIPTRGGHSGIDGPVGQRKLVVWAGSVALAAPAFWMGFIEREEWWLAPGLAVVLLARLLIPGGAGFGRLPREPSGTPVPAPTRPPTLAAHAQPDRGPDGV